MRLLVTRRMTEAAERAMSARFETTIRHDAAPLAVADARAALRGFDAIIPTLGDAFTAEAFAGGGLRARLVANFGAGFNHIDVDAARAAGVVVTNTPGVVTDATADIAMTLILATARRAGEGERILRAGGWEGWQPTQMLGRHVTGGIVGIVGMGRIGKAIAARCHLGFGMRVVFHNRSRVSALDIPAMQLADIDAVLAVADFVVLAVPGGAGTRHMIGAAELARMRDDAFLINISRGDVVDEAALVRALATGQIAGAGLDVYEHEPRVPEALRTMENVTLLPHLGTATAQTRTAMALRAMANVVALDEGREPPDRVA